MFIWYESYRTIHTVILLHRNKSNVRAEFCCERAIAGRSGGLGLTKTGKCLTDDNFFDEIQFLCPYRSIFNRKVFIFILARFLSKYLKSFWNHTKQKYWDACSAKNYSISTLYGRLDKHVSFSFNMIILIWLFDFLVF